MMLSRIFAIAGGACALMAGANAFANVHLNVDINPFAWGAPPPVVYAPPGYYASPPVVYYGGGQWGGRDYDRGHDHHGHDHGGPRHR